MAATNRTYQKVLREIRSIGILLKQDPRLPSVVRLVTGREVKGSWWSDPDAQRIFSVLQKLVESQEILCTKLVNGKDTYLHESVWPAFISLAMCRERWQTAGLSKQARAIFAKLEKEPRIEATGPAARELQTRLLVRAEEVHADTGRHILVLESWESWEKKRGAIDRLRPDEARESFEDLIVKLKGDIRLLPWKKFGKS